MSEITRNPINYINGIEMHKELYRRIQQAFNNPPPEGVSAEIQVAFEMNNILGEYKIQLYKNMVRRFEEEIKSLEKFQKELNKSEYDSKVELTQEFKRYDEQNEAE